MWELLIKNVKKAQVRSGPYDESDFVFDSPSYYNSRYKSKIVISNKNYGKKGRDAKSRYSCKYGNFEAVTIINSNIEMITCWSWLIMSPTINLKNSKLCILDEYEDYDTFTVNLINSHLIVRDSENMRKTWSGIKFKVLNLFSNDNSVVTLDCIQCEQINIYGKVNILGEYNGKIMRYTDFKFK